MKESDTKEEKLKEGKGRGTKILTVLSTRMQSMLPKGNIYIRTEC